MSLTEDVPSSADIVIIGGGVMGTSTAFFLTTETDREVTILEKDSIAAGSSGDSSAIIRHHYGDHREVEPEIYTKMAWWSHNFYRSFKEQTGKSIAHEDNPLVRFGTKDTPLGKAVNLGYEVLKDMDIPATRYEGETLQERYPMYKKMSKFDFAVSDEVAGYSDGSDVAGGFARSAGERGATIITDVSVTGFDQEDEKITAVETGNDTIECNDVIIAAGPWTGRLASDLGIELPLLTTRENVFILDSEDFREKYYDDTPMVSLPSDKWYTRPDLDGNFLVATSAHEEETDPDTYKKEPDEKKLLELIDWIDENMPSLKEADIVGKYCGVYTNTPDHDFILDDLNIKNCYVACGFSGHGFKHAPAVGKIMTDLVTTGDTDLIDADYFKLGRFNDDPQGHRGAPYS